MVLPRENASAPSSNLSQLDNQRLSHVRYSLKLLHMVEFYLLTEFAEVLIAIVYLVYLAAMANLPQPHVLRPTVGGMSVAQWHSTIIYVAQYAGYELLSFLLLVRVFDRILRISCLRLMAFALHKHRRLVQAVLILWVYITIQLTLEHFGPSSSSGCVIRRSRSH